MLLTCLWPTERVLEHVHDDNKNSTHFLISRPLTYKMKKEVADSIRNDGIRKYFDRGIITFFPSYGKKTVVPLPEPTSLLQPRHY